MNTAIENISSNRDSEIVTDLYVEEAIRLTRSKIGYFAILNESRDELTMIGWSKTAMDDCAMISKPIVYPLEQTGLWGDCIREGKPVITNDYEKSVRITKKGYPDGHVDVVHHMNVPIVENGEMVGILGVGNKDSGYTDEDAGILQAFANEGWKYVRQVAEAKRKAGRE